MTLLGLTLGLALSVLTTRFLTSLLYRVQPTDPVTLALIALLITGTTLLATWLPARRAVRTSPLTALRG